MHNILHGIKEALIEIDVVESILDAQLLLLVCENRLDSTGMAPDEASLLHKTVEAGHRDSCGSSSGSKTSSVREGYVAHVCDLLTVIFELPSTLLLLIQHHHGSCTIFHTLLPPLPDVRDSEPCHLELLLK
jgi:hypothetical protein